MFSSEICILSSIIKVMFPSKAKGRKTLPFIKDSGFLLSGFLNCNPAWCICGHQSGPTLTDLQDLGLRRTVADMLTLMVFAETWVIKYSFIDFVYRVRVSCLLSVLNSFRLNF